MGFPHELIEYFPSFTEASSQNSNPAFPFWRIDKNNNIVLLELFSLKISFLYICLSFLGSLIYDNPGSWKTNDKLSIRFEHTLFLTRRNLIRHSSCFTDEANM